MGGNLKFIVCLRGFRKFKKWDSNGYGNKVFRWDVCIIKILIYRCKFVVYLLSCFCKMWYM